MILPSEAQGLAQKGLAQQFKAFLAGLADNRPCILARATYQSYAANFGTQIVLSYTFPKLTLVGSRQVRMRLFGTCRNASGGAPQSFQPVLRVTQDTGAQVIGAITTLAASGLVSAWLLDVDFAVAIPGADGQYGIPVGSAAAFTATSTLNTGNQPSEAIAIAGSMACWLSNTSLTGGVVAGGMLTATTAPASFLLASLNPANTLLNNSKPSLYTLEITGGANVSMTVNGGWLEAL